MRNFLATAAACCCLLLTPSHAHAAFGGVIGGASAGLRNAVYAYPGMNLYTLKVATAAGNTIVVSPGLYSVGCTNLLKNGVNWFFFPGAIISNQYTADVGVFDNTFEGTSGAVTSVISGDLEFIDNATVIVANLIRGSLLTESNSLSQIKFRARKVSNPSGSPNPAIRHLGGRLDFDVDYFNLANGGTAAWWGEGNEVVTGRFMDIDGGNTSALYCEGAGSGNWYLSGEYMDTVVTAGTAAGTIWFKPTNPQQKLWLNCKEIWGGSVAAGYGGVLSVETGKCYVAFQKLSAIEDTTTPRPLIQMGSGQLWMEGMKMTVTNNQHYLLQSGGTAWIRCQQYEDAGAGSSTRPYNYLVSGGTNYLQGGRIQSTWGPWAKLTSGQLYIEDATIDTFSTLQESNVCVWVTGAIPKIIVKNSVFIPGSSFSMSNATPSADLRVWGTGGLMVKSNISTGTVTVRGGSVIVDGTFVDR